MIDVVLTKIEEHGIELGEEAEIRNREAARENSQDESWW